MKSFEDLRVWQSAIELAEMVYMETRRFPADEIYGLTRQLRRCAVSVASNIAEGAARDGKKEFLHFLSIARGSLAELKTQLFIAARIKFLSVESLNILIGKIDETGRMLNALRKSLQ